MANTKENQNVTISLPKRLLRRAKAFAAASGTSLSQLLRDALESQVAQTSHYRAARSRQLKLLSKGFDLGTLGALSFSRDEVHER
jgi:hypothetical protein